MSISNYLVYINSNVINSSFLLTRYFVIVSLTTRAFCATVAKLKFSYMYIFILMINSLCFSFPLSLIRVLAVITSTYVCFSFFFFFAFVIYGDGTKLERLIVDTSILQVHTREVSVPLPFLC